MYEWWTSMLITTRWFKECSMKTSEQIPISSTKKNDLRSSWESMGERRGDLPRGKAQAFDCVYPRSLQVCYLCPYQGPAHPCLFMS